MFRGDDKPTTWDGVGWYPSKVGTNIGKDTDMTVAMVLSVYVGDGLRSRYTLW